MELRPHHLLCIQKFTGHGYSPAFTAHMTALTASLRQSPAQSVTLICGADVLCAKCPHNRKGVCDSAEKVAALDAAVLETVGSMSGTWDTLSKAAREQILRTDKFHQICGTCQWYALCRSTEDSYASENIS
ncbi:MAG: DUF1284 domain-containing protein [Oscillospiraceae bacterium]|nr:DUF1284 domain-containing protein [Oscillospiraceae bacterium]